MVSMSQKQNQIIGGVICLAAIGILISEILVEVLSPYYGWFSAFLLTYILVYVITFFVKYNFISKLISKYLYRLPRREIEIAISVDLKQKGTFPLIFRIGWIVSAFSIYLFMTASLDVVLVLIPGTELIQGITDPCKSINDSVADVISGIFLFPVLVGPIWLFLLRQIRKYTRKINPSKFIGSRSTLIYFYLIIALFAADSFFDVGCKEEISLEELEQNPNQITEPWEFMLMGFGVTIFFAGPFFVFIWVLERFVFPKFGYLENSNKS